MYHAFHQFLAKGKSACNPILIIKNNILPAIMIETFKFHGKFINNPRNGHILEWKVSKTEKFVAELISTLVVNLGDNPPKIERFSFPNSLKQGIKK